MTTGSSWAQKESERYSDYLKRRGAGGATVSQGTTTLTQTPSPLQVVKAPPPTEPEQPPRKNVPAFNVPSKEYKVVEREPEGGNLYGQPHLWDKIFRWLVGSSYTTGSKFVKGTDIQSLPQLMTGQVPAYFDEASGQLVMADIPQWAPNDELMRTAEQLGVDFTTRSKYSYTPSSLQAEFERLNAERVASGLAPVEYQPFANGTHEGEPWAGQWLDKTGTTEQYYKAISESALTYFNNRMAQHEVNFEKYFAEHPENKPPQEYLEGVTAHPKLWFNPDYWAYSITSIIPTVGSAMAATMVGGWPTTITLLAPQMAASTYESVMATGLTDETTAANLATVIGTIQAGLLATTVATRLAALDGTMARRIVEGIATELEKKLMNTIAKRIGVSFTVQMLVDEFNAISAAELDAIARKVVGEQDVSLWETALRAGVENLPQAIVFDATFGILGSIKDPMKGAVKYRTKEAVKLAERYQALQDEAVATDTYLNLYKDAIKASLPDDFSYTAPDGTIIRMAKGAGELTVELPSYDAQVVKLASDLDIKLAELKEMAKRGEVPDEYVRLAQQLRDKLPKGELPKTMKVYHLTNDASFKISKIELSGENSTPNKPAEGLWGSPIDSKFGWKEYVKSETDLTTTGKYEYELTVDTSDVLIINSADDVAKIPLKKGQGKTPMMDFKALKEKGVKGVYLTAKGLSELRNADFYGWDCESLLILDESIVKDIAFLGETEQPKAVKAPRKARVAKKAEEAPAGEVAKTPAEQVKEQFRSGQDVWIYSGMAAVGRKDWATGWITSINEANGWVDAQLTSDPRIMSFPPERALDVIRPREKGSVSPLGKAAPKLEVVRPEPTAEAKVVKPKATKAKAVKGEEKVVELGAGFDNVIPQSDIDVITVPDGIADAEGYADTVLWRDDNRIYVRESKVDDPSFKILLALEYLKYHFDELDDVELVRHYETAAKDGQTIIDAVKANKTKGLATKDVKNFLTNASRGNYKKVRDLSIPTIRGLDDLAVKELGLPSTSDSYYTSALIFARLDDFKDASGQLMYDLKPSRVNVAINAVLSEKGLLSKLFSTFKSKPVDTKVARLLKTTVKDLARMEEIRSIARDKWKNVAGEDATRARQALNMLEREIRHKVAMIKALTPKATTTSAAKLRAAITLTALRKGFATRVKGGRNVRFSDEFTAKLKQVAVEQTKAGKIRRVALRNMSEAELTRAWELVNKERPRKIGRDFIPTETEEARLHQLRDSLMQSGDVTPESYQSILDANQILTDKYEGGQLYVTSPQLKTITKELIHQSTVGLVRKLSEDAQGLANDIKVAQALDTITATSLRGRATPDSPFTLNMFDFPYRDFDELLGRVALETDTMELPIAFRMASDEMLVRVAKGRTAWNIAKQEMPAIESVLTNSLLKGKFDSKQVHQRIKAVHITRDPLFQEALRVTRGKATQADVHFAVKRLKPEDSRLIKRISKLAREAKPEEIAVADAVEKMLKIYEPEIRFQRVYQGVMKNLDKMVYHAGEDIFSSDGYKEFRRSWLPDADAPEAEVRQAVNILLSQGTKALNAYLKDKTWGVREQGYLPFSNFENELSLQKGIASAEKVAHPNLIARTKLPWEKFDSPYIDDLNSYMRYRSAEFLQPYITEMNRIFKTKMEPRMAPEAAQKFARYMNHAFLVMQGRVPMSEGTRFLTRAGSYTFQIITVNPRFTLRNMFQILFHPDFGAGTARALARYGQKIGDAAKKVRDTLASEAEAFEHEASYNTQITNDIMRGVRFASLYIKGEMLLRRICFNMGYHANKDALATYLRTGDIRKLIDSSGVRELSYAERADVMTSLARPFETLATGDTVSGTEAFAIKLARYKSDKSNFIYTRWLRSAFEQTEMGRVVGNLSTYPRNFMKLYMGHIGKLIRPLLDPKADKADAAYSAKRLFQIVASTAAMGWVYSTITGEGDPVSVTENPWNIKALNPLAYTNPYNPLKAAWWSPGGLAIGGIMELFDIGKDLQLALGDPTKVDLILRDITLAADMWIPFYKKGFDVLESIIGKREVDKLILRGIRDALDRNYSANYDIYEEDRNIMEWLQHMLFGTDFYYQRQDIKKSEKEKQLYRQVEQMLPQ